MNNKVENLNIIEDEIVLAPQTQLFDEAMKILNNTKTDEKFLFALQYDEFQKETLISVLQHLGVIIENIDEKNHILYANINMTQLAFIKRSNCIERVMTEEENPSYFNKNENSCAELLDENEIDSVSKPDENILSLEKNISSISMKAELDSLENYSVLQTVEHNDTLTSSISVASVDAYAISPCNSCNINNTSMKTALEMSDRGYMNGYICCQGAEQWFKFTATESRNYTIYTTGKLDTIGTLYDCCGNKMIEVDDFDPRGTLNFRFIKTLVKGATYYIKVRAYGNNIGNYTLYVTRRVLPESVTINDSITIEKGILYELPITPNYTYTGFNGAKRIPGLSVSITPSIADEQEVFWNTTVGSILQFYRGWDENGNRYIHIKSSELGVANLYAEDQKAFGKRDHCIVHVKETVTVKNDGAYSKIVFSNGKVWNCINTDLINEYNLDQNDSFSQRFYDNTYQTKVIDNATGLVYYYEPLIEYSDDELKLIYTIDPLGLAAYVKEYADHNHKSGCSVQESLRGTLEYKDYVFELLYKRPPCYYARKSYGNWEPTNDKSNLTAVISESEYLFGFHVLWDITSLHQLLTLALEALVAVTKIDETPTGKWWVRFAKVVINKWANKAAFELQDVAEMIIEDALDDLIPDQIAALATLISLAESTEELITLLSDKPPIYSSLLHFISDADNEAINYNVMFELSNNQTYHSKELYDLIY